MGESFLCLFKHGWKGENFAEADVNDLYRRQANE
jgi:hypothetical protein